MPSKKLIAIDTLLSLEGVIPSLSVLQDQLIKNMDEFRRSLLAAEVACAEADTLCQLLSAWIDSTVENNLRRSWLTWKNYTLENYFFPSRIAISDPLPLLAQVMQSTHPGASELARKLALLHSTTQETQSAFPALIAALPAATPALRPEDDAEDPVGQKTLSPRVPLFAHMASDIAIFAALMAALWFCCFHALETLYQWLF